MTTLSFYEGLAVVKLNGVRLPEGSADTECSGGLGDGDTLGSGSLPEPLRRG